MIEIGDRVKFRDPSKNIGMDDTVNGLSTTMAIIKGSWGLVAIPKDELMVITQVAHPPSYVIVQSDRGDWEYVVGFNDLWVNKHTRKTESLKTASWVNEVTRKEQPPEDYEYHFRDYVIKASPWSGPHNPDKTAVDLWTKRLHITPGEVIGMEKEALRSLCADWLKKGSASYKALGSTNSHSQRAVERIRLPGKVNPNFYQGGEQPMAGDLVSFDEKSDERVVVRIHGNGTLSFGTTDQYLPKEHRLICRYGTPRS